MLNQTAAWWFGHTSHIIGNAVLAVPDPNITVMKKCDVFPIEFVVRGYMTGGQRASGGRKGEGCIAGDSPPACRVQPCRTLLNSM